MWSNLMCCIILPIGFGGVCSHCIFPVFCCHPFFAGWISFNKKVCLVLLADHSFTGLQYGLGTLAVPIYNFTTQFDGFWAGGTNGMGSPSANDIMECITSRFYEYQLSAIKQVTTPQTFHPIAQRTLCGSLGVLQGFHLTTCQSLLQISHPLITQ